MKRPAEEHCPRCGLRMATLEDEERWVRSAPQSEEPWMRERCWFETPGTCGGGGVAAESAVELGVGA